jgi:hypothetical protein
MKKILAFLAVIGCLGASRLANAAPDTTYVGPTVYLTGDCSSCAITDSEYYLLNGAMDGSSSPLPMAILDHNSTAVPLLVAPAGPAYHDHEYTYLGPVLIDPVRTPTTDIGQYAVYQRPSSVTVGGYSVNVMPNNRFRIIGHHYVPSRESALISADSARKLNSFQPSLPTSFGAGVKEQ